MLGLKPYITKRREIIAKATGTARLFAYGELVCFPVSVGVLCVVMIHAVLVLLGQVLVRFGVCVPILPMLPAWFVAIFVSAAIGYLTNYIAIQMLYYPVETADLSDGSNEKLDFESNSAVRAALTKSRVLTLLTLGFWRKGLIPRNKRRIARVLGRIAEDRFVTAENVAYLVPRLSNLFLSKNSNGEIRGVEFVRRLALAHKDRLACILQQLGRELVTGKNYRTVRNLLSGFGRSEIVSSALTSALFDYMEKNPDSVVLLVREMVAGVTAEQDRKARESESAWERLKAGATSAIVEGVARIGYPQIRSFLLGYVKVPEHREQLRARLESLMPLFCDKIAEKIVDRPELLKNVFSGHFILQLVEMDISDDGFWGVIAERVAPELHVAICNAIETMPQNDFEYFFSANHQIADVVERTVVSMRMLDFYQMLDEVMAEHLGAIQVFGFILGAAIGYLQYSVILVGNGTDIAPLVLFAVPFFVVFVAKLIGVKIQIGKL